MKLKVCGMREKKNIISLTDLKPNYIGFIFWISSTRYVDQSTPSLPEAIKKTGVFVRSNLSLWAGLGLAGAGWDWLRLVAAGLGLAGATVVPWSRPVDGGPQPPAEATECENAGSL